MAITYLFAEQPGSKPLRFADFRPGPAAWDYRKFDQKHGCIYVLSCADFHKIGMTTNLETRVKGVQASNPLPVDLVAYRTVPLSGMAYAEAYLHQTFAEQRMYGEWFRTPWAEIKPALARALVRAHAYDWHSREWDQKQRSKPMSAKDRAEYEEYLQRRSANAAPIEALL